MKKIKFWKKICNLASSTNPWNAVYKLASNKAKSQILSTLQKLDGSLTTDTKETVTYMLDYLITKDEKDDSDYHKTIILTERPIQTAHGRVQEIGNEIDAINMTLKD